MEPRVAALSRDDLARVVGAVRAMARASRGDDPKKVTTELLAILARATDSDRAAYYRLEDDGTMFVLSAQHPEDAKVKEVFRRLPVASSASGIARRTGRATSFFTRDLGVGGAVASGAGIKTIAAIPIATQGSSGSINVGRHVERAYTEGELGIGELVAELFVEYVQHAYLYAEARGRLDETRMLLDVSRAVAASLELDRRLAVSAEILTRVVDASNAFVMLLDDGGATLRGVAASNPKHVDHFKTVRIPMSASSLAVTAVKTKHAVAIADARSSAAVRQDLVESYGEKALLAVPLVVDEEAIGAVVLDDTRTVRAWAPAEVARSELIANQIASAVATSRLYEEVRQRSIELERAQQALVARERLAALGQLAATLAHEVRNPLGVLFNSIGTLRKRLPVSGEAADLLGIMDEEAQRLDRLVRELLDFAKPIVPSLESEPLRPVVDGALDAVAVEIGEHGPKLGASIAKDLPPLRIDGSQLRRALVNLVRNAAQAAGPGGRVTVRAGVEHRPSGDVARIDVVDTGPGIPAELAPRVFEPFFTTKATGTGLGLAIVKSIVEGHGGEVSLTSARGVGTTVSVFLPLALDGAAPPSQIRRGW